MTLTPFAPPPGLNSDDTTFAAEGRWADGNNVRFWQGKPQTIGGWANGAATLSTEPKDLFWSIRAAGDKLLYGDQAGLFIGSSLQAPVSNLVVVADTGWSFAAWGEAALCCVRGAKLYYQTGTSAAAEVVNAPDQINDILVTPERQVLAFGCNEEVSTTFNGRCIRGSDLEDYTDWTTTSTNNAFEHILDGPGDIICGRQIGPYVAVWTQYVLYLGTFLGDPGQTYRFDRIDDIPGPLSARCTHVVNGVAYWVGRDFKFYRWAPGAPPEQMLCPIFNDYAANIENSTIYTFIWHNEKFNELWFHYADAREGENQASRYLAFSLNEGTWFRGIMSRRIMLQGRAGGEVAIGMDRDSNRFLHTETTTYSNRTAYIQSADQTLDNSQRRIMIRSVHPDFEDQSGNVSLTLFVRDRPQSTAVTKGAYTLSTSTTKKDFRASGKLVAVKFSVAAGAHFRLGKPLFDVAPMGER